MIRRFMPERIPSDEGLPTFGQPSDSRLGPVVRVLVWNIFKARRAAFATDFRTLVHDRDLVLLQEAVLHAPSDRLFTDSRRHQWVMGRSFREPHSRREHGVKTGSVSPAIDKACWHSPHAEPLSNTRKSLLATRYRIGGVEADIGANIEAGVGTATGPRTTGAEVTTGGADMLLVLNVHAINFVPAAKYLAHLRQMEEAMSAHRGPLILAGDFNTWSARRRDSLFALTRKVALREAPLVRRARVAHLSMHLDHLMYRGLTLRSARSLEQVTSSDHAPIVATFEFPETPPALSRAP